jgi:hypothetical protein
MIAAKKKTATVEFSKINSVRSGLRVPFLYFKKK